MDFEQESDSDSDSHSQTEEEPLPKRRCSKRNIGVYLSFFGDWSVTHFSY